MGGTKICTPIGIPSLPDAKGIEIAGCPTRFEVIVHTSFTYIVMGSEVLSPNLNAVQGDVGAVSYTHLTLPTIYSV